jgi:hypothetical protein
LRAGRQRGSANRHLIAKSVKVVQAPTVDQLVGTPAAVAAENWLRLVKRRGYRGWQAAMNTRSGYNRMRRDLCCS